MRYNVDLLKEDNQDIQNANVELLDRMSDPYLAMRINKYKNVSYETLILNLYKNPFLYNPEKEDLKIEYVDEFCLEYEKHPLSIGGLILTKDIKKSKKKKIIKTYFKRCEDDYNKDLTDKMVQMENVVNIAESFKPHKIKFWTFLFYLLMAGLLFLINFPPKELLNVNFIGSILTNIFDIISNNKILNMFRYITLISSIITFLYIIFYSLRTHILSKKYNNTFNRIGKLSKKIEKETNKSFKKIINHYLKLVNLKDTKKYKSYPTKEIMNSEYQLDNIEKLNQDSVKKMSKIKKKIAFIYGFRHIIYLITILIVIAYIVLIFVL